MALVEGNKTNVRNVPSGTSYTFNHNHNVGADGSMVLIMTTRSAQVNSVTYGGQSMTKINQTYVSFFSKWWTVWELKNPPTGTNTVSVTLSTAIWDYISNMIYSFTGSAGVGNHAVNNTGVTNPQVNIVTSANSMLIGSGMSFNSAQTIYIATGTQPKDWNHNVGAYVTGGISPNLAIAGGKTVRLNTSWAAAVVRGIEVKEATAPPPSGKNEGSFLYFFN